MTTVNVIDAPCGYGKSSWAIQYMNSVPEEYYNFVYVTPFLSEVDRVKENVTTRKFHDPNDENGDTKLDDLHDLLAKQRNICTTHALFKKANAETKELLRVNNYILILDEVMTVVEQYPLKNDDLRIMFDSNLIYEHVDDKGLKFIRWNEEKIDSDSKYNGVKALALTNNLMYVNNAALVWNFPCDIFDLFKEVYILTYLFCGQIQKSYFDLHGVSYRYLSVIKEQQEYSLVPYKERVPLNKRELLGKISIYEGSLNYIGDKPYTLSMSWFKESKNKNFIKILQNNARNYLMNVSKATNKITLWTTYKGGDKETILKKMIPRGFKKSYIPITERATNEYKEKYILAYLANRFMRGIEVNFFHQYGVKVDQDTWAVSELIQWVWRSRIREGESISIYIPSKRMRDLFIRFLNSDEFEIPPDTAIIDEHPSDWHL
jgi:hypothetical protein